MPVTVDVQFADSVATGTTVIPISTTLTTTDMILVFVAKVASGSATVTGLGGALAAFHRWQLDVGSALIYCHTGTGVSGAQSITLTTATGLSTVTIYVVHGLTNRSITGYNISSWYAIDGTTTGTQTTTPANTDEGPASLPCGYEQIAFFVAGASLNNTNYTFPSNPVPASGWTVDRPPPGGTSSGLLARNIPTAAGTAQAAIRHLASTCTFGTAMLVLGTAGTPPATGFTGWGAPV